MKTIDNQTADWQKVFLKQNPFPTIPSKNPEEVIWAGFSKLRSELKVVFVESLSTNRTQVVLNWGEYGSGKTHAATFNQLKENILNGIEMKLKDIELFYIQTPREQDKADMLLYRNILEAIKFRRIRLAVRDVTQKLGSEKTLQKLQQTVDSEVLGKAIWLLGQDKSRSGQLLLLNDETISTDWDLLLESYFYSQATKTDLRRLGLSRGIDSAHDRFRVLGGILNTLIGFEPTEDLGQHTRISLWLDEMENLIYFTSKYYLPFTQGLRELIDQLPSYFTIFLNITLASPEAFQDIETILGKALLDRKTNEIYFKEPDEHEAYQYVIELLESFRTGDWNPSKYPSSYPFEPDALKVLISTLKTRTPRDINQACSDVITTAIRDKAVGSPKQLIDHQFVIKWGNSKAEQNL